MVGTSFHRVSKIRRNSKHWKGSDVKALGRIVSSGEAKLNVFIHIDEKLVQA